MILCTFIPSSEDFLPLFMMVNFIRTSNYFTIFESVVRALRSLLVIFL